MSRIDGTTIAARRAATLRSEQQNTEPDYFDQREARFFWLYQAARVGAVLIIVAGLSAVAETAGLVALLAAAL